MTGFSRAGLIVRTNDDSVANTLAESIDIISALGIDIVLEHSTRALAGTRPTVPIDQIGQTCDVAIVIGGDGTLLHAARELSEADIPLIGVNRGRLGFLVDVSPDNGLEQLTHILQGNYLAEERLILTTRVIRDGQEINASPAFNDAVIRVKETLKIMDFDVLIDDVIVTHQRADGVVIATPSGSTAYSLSNGGPIVGPTVDAVVLQPICPHTLTSRPLLVDANSCIRVHLWDDQVFAAQVVCDGQVYMDATLGDMIEISAAPNRVRLLHPETYDFHRILREKLNWG